MKNKFIFVFIILLLILVSINVHADTIKKGDVNMDGKVSSTDYIMVRKYILKTGKLTNAQIKIADMNKDNKISAADYILIKKEIINGNNKKEDKKEESKTTPTPTPTPSKEVVVMPTGFEITGWIFPTAEQMTKENAKTIKEAGFTLVQLRSSSSDITEYKNKMIAAINTLNEYGIKVVVSIKGERGRKILDIKNENELTDEVNRMIDFFSPYSNVVGYYVADEPNVKDFTRIKNVFDMISKKDSKRFKYVNLFPNYASVEQLGASYDDYIRRFSELKPGVLAVDHYSQAYVFPDVVKTYEAFYDNLRATYKYSRSSNSLPVMTILDAKSPVSSRDITINDIAAQVNLCLAFGMKRVGYWSYLSNGVSPDGIGLITIDKNGVFNKNKYYAYAKEVNDWLLKIGKELYNTEISEVNGVLEIYGVNEMPNLTPYNNKIGRISSDAGGILTFYKNNSFLLVNTDVHLGKTSGTYTIENNLMNYQFFNPQTNVWQNIGGDFDFFAGKMLATQGKIILNPGYSILLRSK